MKNSEDKESLAKNPKVEKSTKISSNVDFPVPLSKSLYAKPSEDQQTAARDPKVDQLTKISSNVNFPAP